MKSHSVSALIVIFSLFFLLVFLPQSFALGGGEKVSGGLSPKSSSGKGSAGESITVYAYDSFCGDWGAGTEIVRDFENETGIHVNLVGVGDAVTMYSRFVMEGEKSEADVLVGLANNMQIDESLFLEWEPACKVDLIDYDSKSLIPFDYGFYCFLVNKDYFRTSAKGRADGAAISENPGQNAGGDTSLAFNAPSCLMDLTRPEFSDSFILIDPRTSSVGLGLLKWTILSLGEDAAFDWWRKACDAALTVGSSWSSSYGVFTQGEAPFTLSYTTSPVYHRMYEDNYAIDALVFSDGYVETVEYIAVPKSSGNPEAAKQFCEYVLTRGQEEIAVTNTMFPANKRTALPDEYKGILNPDKILEDKNFPDKQNEYLDRWTRTVVL